MIKKAKKNPKKSNKTRIKAIMIAVPISALFLGLSVIFIPLLINPLQNNPIIPPPNPPPNPPPIYDISYYDKAGSFTIGVNTAFEGNSIYYPIDLGRDGMNHPLIIWGDGTFASPSTYSGLLRHLASHGFIVIGPNDQYTGNGDTMILAMDLLISKNSDSNSQFYQKLDVDNICIMGHSQGGGSTLILGENEKVTCTVPIQPWVEIYGDISLLSQVGPMFLITATNDWVCPPESNSNLVFLNSNVPTIYGNLIGGDHLTPLGDAGAMRKYITAWCYAHLFENIDAQSVFYGNNALIHDDSQWIWETTNI